jgi:hypothetical protein
VVDVVCHFLVTFPFGDFSPVAVLQWSGNIGLTHVHLSCCFLYGGRVGTVGGVWVVRGVGFVVDVVGHFVGALHVDCLYETRDFSGRFVSSPR